MPLPPIGPQDQAGGQPVQSLMDMVQPQMPAGGWAPDWVTQQLAAFNRDAPAGGQSSDIGFSGAPGSLVPWLNPANWGAPPAINGPMAAVQQGWFPQQFAGGGNDPNQKFWTQKSYMNQYQNQYGGDLPGGGIDERPNTQNWRLLEGVAPGSNTLPGGGPAEPGNFMYAGHPISQGKILTDLLRNANPAAGGEGTGTPGGIIHHYSGFGPEGTAWSTAGQVGLPGQLDPYWTSWGAGGPGG